MQDILTTKFHPPPLRPVFVARPRLLARLDDAPQHKVTLVTAPAGFGKTSLLREWVDHCGLPAAWLSLDAGDNDLARFLVYLTHAFRQIAPDAGDDSLALLGSGGLPYAEAVLTYLTNDLALVDDPRILILDDYQSLDAAAIHDALDFLIAHLPQHIHLIFASRSQAPLNLARLRGGAQLLELGAADLRFTAYEVEQFFADVMQLDLSPADRGALEMRTEGWVAGLQLAGLSLQTRADQAGFIAGFSGSDRHVADYLFEEVLQHQPESLQKFLLHTALLDHLCADLCDAVLGQGGGQSSLELLESRQLFIVPLDNERRWYRYHHLFADLLRHYMDGLHPEAVPTVYGRASQWFEAQDRPEDAIRYARKAGDWARTADLLQAALERDDWLMRGMRQLLAGFDALPESELRARPSLELAYAWLLFENFSNAWSQIEAHLNHVEDALNDDSEAQSMLAAVDLLRANHARHSGDAALVIHLCEQALDRLPDDDLYTRSGATVHLASGYESAGNLAKADAIYAEGIAMCERAGNLNGLLFASARHIEVLGISGELRRAEAVFARATQAAGERSGPDVGMLAVTIGEVFREQNRLDEAESLLRRGVDLCSPFDAWKAGTLAGTIALARTLAARGHMGEAVRTLDDLRGSPHIAADDRACLDAAAARLDLMGEHLHSALRWSQECGLSPSDEIDPARAFEWFTLARVLIARAAAQAEGVFLGDDRDPLQDVYHVLGRWLDVAEKGGGHWAEVQMLRALVHALRGDTDAALGLLNECLRHAESQGYVRLFADDARLLAPLLKMLLNRPGVPAPKTTIETILEAAQPHESHARVLPGTTLTARESRTLRLLASDATTDEIAAMMSVSVSTVRTYAKRIYGKLGVHSRAEAVYLARELDLL